MLDITTFLKTDTGTVLLWILLLVFIALLFRGPLGRLIDRVTKAEVSRKSVKIEAKPSERGRITSEADRSPTLQSGEQVDVNFGHDNSFAGNWSNVAIGGNVTTQKDESIPQSPQKSPQKKAKKT